MKPLIRSGSVLSIGVLLIATSVVACGKNGSFRARRFTAEEIRDWEAKNGKKPSDQPSGREADPAQDQTGTIDPTRNSIPYSPAQTNQSGQQTDRNNGDQNQAQKTPSADDDKGAHSQLIVDPDGDNQAPKGETIEKLINESRDLVAQIDPRLTTFVKGIQIHIAGEQSLGFSVEALVSFEGADHHLFVKDAPVAAYEPEKMISSAKFELRKTLDGPEVPTGNSILAAAICGQKECEEVFVRLDFAVQGGYVTAIFQLGLIDGQFKVVANNVSEQLQTYEQALAGQTQSGDEEQTEGTQQGTQDKKQDDTQTQQDASTKVAAGMDEGVEQDQRAQESQQFGPQEDQVDEQTAREIRRFQELDARAKKAKAAQELEDANRAVRLKAQKADNEKASAAKVQQQANSVDEQTAREIRRFQDLDARAKKAKATQELEDANRAVRLKAQKADNEKASAPN